MVKIETKNYKVYDEPMVLVADEETNEETFGSDFISIAMTTDNVNWLPFNSNTHFIFFNDDYNDSIASESIDTRNIKSSKRKLGVQHYSTTNDIRLNPMSIRYRATDKNRKKVKKMCKEKSMKGMEQNKFGKKKLK